MIFVNIKRFIYKYPAEADEAGGAMPCDSGIRHTR